ncbi:thiolase-like protein [Aspergillus oleicola]
MASSSVPREPSHAAEGNYAPIAIVGIGCHLPEGIHSPSQLWDFLAQGRCAVSEMPTSRFNINGYHGAQEEPGTAKARGGCFIQEDIHKFENQFFGINNREAAAIDPQQRKLLEVVFESFESAGVPLEDVQRANLGCYVASFTPDFIAMQTKDPQTLNRYSQTGLGTSILANRISHVFNLKGPSCVVDTACLSSMYALHMACTALQRGECDAAVVAGVNLIQSPELHVSISQGGVLSQSSMCRTFDAAADGYVRAEGVIAIYIKRLDEAVHNRDSIRSIIRATAVNSNGHTPGIALPSADGQEAVIRKAYAIGGLDPMETPYVETHGTGTSVGDPIEVEALSRVFYRPSQPTLIGSVKPSLGHGEASSGLLSIIKAILAFEHGLIPATIGITQINPNIKAAEWGVQVVTAMTRFPAHDSSSIRHPAVTFSFARLYCIRAGGSGDVSNYEQFTDFQSRKQDTRRRETSLFFHGTGCAVEGYGA